MGLVLWIDQNTFSAGLVEKAFKRSGIPFYSLSTVADFAYLVEDLKPEVIVLDTETYLAHEKVFLEQYEASSTMQKLPMILLGSTDLTMISNSIGKITKPFDPFIMPAKIQSMLGAN